MSRALRSAAAALLAVALAATARDVRAQTDDERRATARELAEKAQDEIEAGDHEEALDLLRQADEAFHAPTISLLIARTLVKLERFAEAAETFDAITAETIPPDAPPAWGNAQRLAAEERLALSDRVATIRVEVAPAEVEATIWIGERKERPARGQHLVDAEEATDVRVKAKGYRSSTQTVSIGPGDVSDLTITLEPLAPDEPPPPDAPPAPAEPSFLQTPWPTVIAGGAAGVALVIGAGLGAAAFGEASELEDRCGDARCSGASPSEREELRAVQDSGGALADGSTVAFVVSGVAATAAGVFLVLWITGDEEGAAPAASAQLKGGPGWASVTGTF